MGKVVYTNVGLTAEVFAVITAIVGVMLLIISVLVTIKYCRQKRRLKRVTQEYNERLLARIRGLHEGTMVQNIVQNKERHQEFETKRKSLRNLSIFTHKLLRRKAFPGFK